MKLLENSIATLFLGLTLFFVPTSDTDRDIRLEIPATHSVVGANEAGTIPDANVDVLRIVVRQQSMPANYGSVITKINAESSNVVMSVRGTDDGIVCDLDLARRGGFRLHPGRNSVEIAFVDRRHRQRYASFLLLAPEPEPTAPVITVSRPEGAGADKYAVVVGIAKYRGDGNRLPRLRYADRDAKAFYDLLVAPDGGGFSPQNVTLLINEDATLEKVRKALSNRLARVRPDDTVIFYFAGHGGPDLDEPTDESGKTNIYLAAADADPGNIRGTALSVYDLQSILDESGRARHVVTLADACHALGVAAGREPETKPQNLINQYLEKFAGGKERGVITASDTGQISQESERWGGGHGVFTYFVLQGLQGRADVDQDGVVTAGELFSYVRQHVYKETDGEQRPVVDEGSTANLVLTNKKARVTARLGLQNDEFAQGRRPK